MAFQRGDIVDHYRLDEPLGVGAFGEVWKASQLADGEAIGVTCAVKVMRLTHDRAGSSPRTFASGWLDEVRNLVRVAGDTIPRIHEANVWHEHAYIAMEWLEGNTLGTRLAQGPIPWRRALFIADQIARALEVAHQIGVIHRDLKPQNVMLVGSKRACVVDWGIARLNTSTQTTASGVARQPTADIETTDARPVTSIVTPHQQRVAVGTPGYMAPEVYEGAHPAPGQDVYALGVVLYEMIAGCLPHSVESTKCSRTNPDSMKAYRASLDKATMDYSLVPLRYRCPGVPSGVTQLVDSLLAREPDQRPRQLRNAIDLANRFPHGVPDPPYAGLSTLGLQHAGLYFGQQDAIQHVLDRLKSQRGVLLWGPSGSGKSSLALAGVAATMDRMLFLDTDGWDIYVVRPREGQGLRVASHAASSGHPTIGRVVVVDQLEEVVDLDPQAQHVFCAAVLALLERSAPVSVRDTVISVDDEVRVIATVRDDLEWRVDREVPALRPLFERRIIVKGVDANFARSIIEEPARALGYNVEGIEAVSREVEERLSSEPAKLPVIQYALSEWWERRDNARKALPRSAWREIGGVDGALSFVAERFFSALDPSEQPRVKALFVQLFHGGRKQPLAESVLTPGDRLMMEELTGLRLVGRREKKGGAPFYEAEHEYLSENWTRLAGWLAEARDDRALTEELERDAAAYLRNHDPERLWRKGRLAAAVEMARLGRIVSSASAKQFLQQSKRQERRGQLVSRTSIGVGAVLVLVVVSALVLNAAASAAASKERDQAIVELLAAEVDRAKARQLLENANKKVESANNEVESANKKIEGANEEAQRLREETDQQTRNAAEMIKKVQDDIRSATERAEEQIAKAQFWEKLAAQSEHDANVAQSRVNAAEQRAKLVEQNAKAAEHDAEQNAKAVEQKAKVAEQKANIAEQKANIAEQKAKAAEQNAKAAEQNAKAANIAEQNAKAAEQKAKSFCELILIH